MANRGRKIGSVIRDNLVEILFVVGQNYGYDLYKNYKKIFGNVNIRSIYYNLNKGVSLGVFTIAGVESIEGDYSWGKNVNRTLYKLSSNAIPKADKRVELALRK